MKKRKREYEEILASLIASRMVNALKKARGRKSSF